MRGIQLVVLDIAGTIIEDNGEVLTAFGTALKANGICFSETELEEWKGASKREVIRHFVGRQAGGGKPVAQDAVEQTYKLFRSELERVYRHHIRPIEGATSTFAWCREHDIKLATTTGFYSEIRDMVLELMGWRDLFAANICSSDVKRGRPAPFMIFRAMETAGIEDVQQVVNVGDTPLDLQAGTNARVRGVVGVLTGFHGKDRLEREPHTHILSSIAELPLLLEREF